MVRVLLRETANPLTFIMNVISVNFIACFWIICWFLQTLNYGGNEKYVLVLVPCHDGMITNSINLFGVLHSSSTRARPEPNNVALSNIIWITIWIKKFSAVRTLDLDRDLDNFKPDIRWIVMFSYGYIAIHLISEL